ncbi:MAG: LPS export ABC transporter periplasmic protein LptC [Caulobacterales bacterium]
MTVTPAAARPSNASAIIRRDVRAHSRAIHILRWLLPVAIAAILAMLGMFVGVQAERTEAARPKEIPTKILMVNPHFLGRDDQGRAFNLSAHQAVRDDKDLQRVLLAAPVVVLDVDGAHPSTMTADNGLYREDTRILLLTGHVRVDDSRASTVATDQAVVDTRAGTVSGTGPVAGSGAMGAIQAHGYTATQKGEHVILRGGVHAQLKGR